MTTTDSSHSQPPARPHSETEPVGGRDLMPFRHAVKTWFAISLQTFGGPAGQIAVMQRTLVEDKRWIGRQRFDHESALIPWPYAWRIGCAPSARPKALPSPALHSPTPPGALRGTGSGGRAA